MAASISQYPTLVFVPGAWHKPLCYSKLISPLESKHNIKCLTVTLPSTQDNPNATFKDDVDAARAVIIPELSAGRNVIVICHSYGGLVGNSCIKGLALHASSEAAASHPLSSSSTSSDRSQGYVVGLVMIATGFNIEGLSMMDPFFGHAPPQWVVDRETGYARLVVDRRDFFYHDLPREEGEYWVSQLTTQSLKALFEGGEYTYAGWRDVPVWYIGTIEDRGLPPVVQRMSLGWARAQGAVVRHTEIRSSHSPFLSCVDECVEVLLDAVRTTSGLDVGKDDKVTPKDTQMAVRNPHAKLLVPMTWFRYGLPLMIGHGLGWAYMGVMGAWRFFRRR